MWETAEAAMQSSWSLKQTALPNDISGATDWLPPYLATLSSNSCKKSPDQQVSKFQFQQTCVSLLIGVI